MVSNWSTTATNTAGWLVVDQGTTASNYTTIWSDSTHTWAASSGTSIPLSSYRPYVPPDVPPPTPEEAQAAEQAFRRQQEDAERVAAAHRREERRAKLKSLRLLKEVLGPQWQEYRVDKAVVVPSGGHKPGARYRIRPNRMIDVLDAQGRVTDCLCIHTVDWVPDGDDVAAKYLMATADEARLWRTANRHPPARELVVR